MNNNIDLNAYKTFYAVAKAGGFSKAAEILYVSQPAVSASIKKLEEQLETNLIKRNNKRFQLTEAGEQLLIYLETIFNTLQIAEKKIKENKNLVTGEIKIGAPTHIGIFLVNDWIEEFKKTYPGVKIHIENKSTQDMLSKLIKRELDIIIDSTPIDNTPLDVQQDELEKFEMCFIANKKYEKLSKAIINFETLEKYPLLLPAERTSTRTELDKLVKKENSGLSLNPSIEVSTTEVMYDLVKRGIGIGYFTKISVMNDLMNNNLVEIKTKNVLPQTEICAVYVPEFLNNATEKFLKHIKEKISKRKIRARKELRIVYTQQCNYKCEFCHAEGIKSKIKEIMKTEDIVKLYKFLNTNYGINSIHITGGEPMLKSELPQLIKILSDEGARITITSNGYYLPEDDRIFNNIDKINISLHSMNEKDYENISKITGSHAKVINNIKKLRVNYPVLKICINATLTKELAEDSNNIIDLIDFSHSIRANLKIIELLPNDSQAYVISTDKLIPLIEKKNYIMQEELFRKKVFVKNSLKITLLKCTCSAVKSYSDKGQKCYENNDIYLTMDGNLHVCRVTNEVVEISNELKNDDSKGLKNKLDYYFEKIGNRCRKDNRD